LSRKIARKKERCRTIGDKVRNKGNNPFRHLSSSEVVEESSWDNSVECPSHVK
jgi:hypothetical protein